MYVAIDLLNLFQVNKKTNHKTWAKLIIPSLWCLDFDTISHILLVTLIINIENWHRKKVETDRFVKILSYSFDFWLPVACDGAVLGANVTLLVLVVPKSFTQYLIFCLLLHCLALELALALFSISIV